MLPRALEGQWGETLRHHPITGPHRRHPKRSGVGVGFDTARPSHGTEEGARGDSMRCCPPLSQSLRPKRKLKPSNEARAPPRTNSTLLVPHNTTKQRQSKTKKYPT